jgi:hypothetical protein
VTAPERLTVLVSGMLAGNPSQGGATWAVLQYVLGLRRLGHDVTVIEPLAAHSRSPAGVALDASDQASAFTEVMGTFGLEHNAALFDPETRETVGLEWRAVVATASRADVLLNLSGLLAVDDVTAQIPVRIWLDLDPAFNQLWHASGIDMAFATHTHFATVGQSIGTPTCAIPTFGLDWIPTVPPVVLGHWPVAPGDGHAVTTIANWRSYGSVEHAGVFYGQKAHSFRLLLDLPGRVEEPVAVALDIHQGDEGDRAALEAEGWQLEDPRAVAGTPARYQAYIQTSRAELGVAKAGYVTAQCGWFSDRSAAYLASGRPVVAQDAGFSAHLPVGEGLFSFADVDGATAALDDVRTHYDRHRKAARDLAEEYLDSDRVLSRLLERVGA